MEFYRSGDGVIPTGTIKHVTTQENIAILLRRDMFFGESGRFRVTTQEFGHIFLRRDLKTLFHRYIGKDSLEEVPAFGY